MRTKNYISRQLGLLLIIPALSLYAEETRLAEEELMSLLSGKTIEGIYLENNQSFIRYYDEDGEVRQRAGKEFSQGKWLINQQDQRCIVWSNEEKSCRIIVKDKGLYKEFAIQAKGKRKLMVIYNKVIEGNPDDL